ncbi:MAG: TRAP transporter small permease [Betaproteobacteria bacterium]|nr:MAG: TRAP transporter small permease [Betaproteobacteria bacterium]TAG46199.1 MAG: TRAP transporter small permease [Betaproteobacteria bacterium]
MSSPANPPNPNTPVVIRALAKGVDYSVMIVGAILIFLVFANVVLRVVGKDLAWVVELGEMLMVWVTFLGGVAAAQRGGHMSINEFLDKLSVERRRLADAAILLLCAGVLSLLLFYGWKIMMASWNNTLTTLEWPMAWQYMPLPLSAALMLCFVGWDLVQTLRGVPRELRYPEEQ